MADIRALSLIKAHYRCPDCDRYSLSRSSTPTGVTSMDQVPLWDLIERCTMCSFEAMEPNVKIGA